MQIRGKLLTLSTFDRKIVFDNPACHNWQTEDLVKKDAAVIDTQRLYNYTFCVLGINSIFKFIFIASAIRERVFTDGLALPFSILLISA